MICEKCKDRGPESQARQGMSYTTAMCSDTYYDEKGKRHYHDPNKSTTEYRCSNGHTWTIVSGPTPCWCGWPQGELL